MSEEERQVFDPNASDKPETIDRRVEPDPDINIPGARLRRWFRGDPVPARQPPSLDYYSTRTVPPGEISIFPPEPVSGLAHRTNTVELPAKPAPAEAPSTPFTPKGPNPDTMVRRAAVVDAWQAMAPYLERLEKAGLNADIGPYKARIQKFLDENPSEYINPVDARAIKRDMDVLSDKALRAEERGGQVNSLQSDMNNTMRSTLRTEGERVAPGINAIDAKTRLLRQIAEAFRESKYQGQGLKDLTVTGEAFTGHPGAAISTAALTSPAVAPIVGRAMHLTGNLVSGSGRLALLAALAQQAQEEGRGTQ